MIDTSHGPEVLEKAYHEHPDLIIMDLMMQGMDGFEVMGRLRDNLSTETIPVIMMSASSKGESTALRLGAATYMIKPLQPGAVKVAVRAALRDSENATDNTVRRSSRNATEESAPRGSRNVTAEAALQDSRNATDEMVRRDSENSTNEAVSSRGSTVVKTGIAQLDDALRGGIPLGSLALVEGAQSSGKSVLCQYLTHESLRDGLDVAYLTCGDTAEDLINMMDSLGLDVSRYLRRERLRIQHLEKPTPNEDSDQLMQLWTQEIERLPSQYSVTIVDSITNPARRLDANGMMRFFAECGRICKNKRTIILVSESYVFDKGLLNRLNGLCNTHLSLGEEAVGTRMVKTLEVRKARNVEQRAGNVISFQVEEGTGVKIVPRSKIRV